MRLTRFAESDASARTLAGRMLAAGLENIQVRQVGGLYRVRGNCSHAALMAFLDREMVLSRLFSSADQVVLTTGLDCLPE